MCRQTPQIRAAKILMLNQNLCVYDSAILLKYHS